MLDLFLCHSQADREAAVDIAGHLERAAEARIWRKECDAAAGETVADKWDAGLSSAAILLLLSPEAVPRARTRAAWQSLLEHIEGGASPPLGPVLLRNCDYARLLERRRFFRWSDGRTAVLRALASWLLTLHRPGETKLFEPARLPWFQGRAAELELLWDRLVDGSGTVVLAGEPGSGKTGLAQEFARAAVGHFRDILWVDCGGRSPAFVAGDLESQLGIRPPTPLVDALQHRVLLVLDDVAGEPPVVLPAEGLASVLVTTRHARPGSVDVPPVTAAFRAGPPADPECERLWRAMAVCRRNAVPLELAAAIAGLAPDVAQLACERLVAEGFVDPLDFAGTRFRLSARSQQAALVAPDASLRRAHAAALPGRPAFIAEIENALEWALLNDWDLARALAIRSFGFLKKEERLREAARTYELLRDQASACGDLDLARECSWELSWIQDEPGEIRRRATEGQQLALDFN